MKPLILSILTIFLLNGLIEAQEVSTDSIRDQALKVFIDCPDCDLNYLKEQITFVNYVRESKEAEVHIMVTSQQNGSGGHTYYAYFIGQQRFDNKDDTLTFTTKADATSEELRFSLTHNIKMGLVPYIMKTPYADLIDLNIDGVKDVSEEVTTDKWNSWVFTLSGQGYFSGEDSYKNLNIYSYFNISKVKEKWKTSLYLSQNYSENEYNYEDYNYTSINRSLYAEYEFVGAISSHWSWGGYLSANSSTFSNIDASYALNPGIEYNIFKYSEANRKQIRCIYKFGYDFNDYIDTTIYNKTNEILLYNYVGIAASTVQKWGRLSISLTGSAYTHDISKNSFSIYTSADIRLFKGLELSIYGNYSMIHNQLGIPKGDLTQEELLLQQRQVQTQFSLWGSIGLSYTFGSIFNNVVNPRFGS